MNRRTNYTDGSYLVALTSTPLHEGGPPSEAFAAPDGWNVNVHFVDSDDGRAYVFNVEQAERFVESIQRALPAAKLARDTP